MKRKISNMVKETVFGRLMHQAQLHAVEGKIFNKWPESMRSTLFI